MKCDDCCSEGGNNFVFNHANLYNLPFKKFHVAGENNMISITYIKDGVLYISNSFDCGETWSSPQQIYQVKGDVTELEFMAKGDHMVVAFIETIDNKHYKRAFSGSLNSTENTLSFRACESSPPNENLNNLQVTICDPPGKFKSYDHSFGVERNGTITHNCEGHG